MQYEQHDFQQNITGALKAGDSEKVVEILMKEVGRVLALDKKALIQVVRKSGKDLPDNIDDKGLLRVITSGLLNQNKAFLNNLIELLIIENQKYFNVDLLGIGSVVQGAGSLAQAIGGSIANVKAAKAGVVSAKEGTKQAQEATKQAQQNMMGMAFQSKNSLEAARLEAETRRLEAGEKTKTAIKITAILGGVIALSVIGFIIYKSTQRSGTAAGATAS